jgi:hypothetical protein
MIIKATFTGSDSLGYENGREYELRVANDQGVYVRRLDGMGKCPYQSLSAFLKNWNKITVCS